MRRLARPDELPPVIGAPPDEVALVLSAYHSPALAYDATMTVVAVNEAMRAYIPELVGREPINLLMWLFTMPQAQQFFVDWPTVAENAIARLRVSWSRFRDTDPFVPLLDRLCEASTTARHLWQTQATIAVAPMVETFRLRDLTGAVREVTFATLGPIDTPVGLHIVFCVAGWP